MAGTPDHGDLIPQVSNTFLRALSTSMQSSIVAQFTEDRMLSGAMIFAFQAPAAVAMADLFAKEPRGGRFLLPSCVKELAKNFIINHCGQSLIVIFIYIYISWLDFEAFGGHPEQQEKASENTLLLNRVLASLKPQERQGMGSTVKLDTLYISAKTFWLAGGVRLTNAQNVTLLLDGTLEFRAGARGRSGWPEQEVDKCNLDPLQPRRSSRLDQVLIENVNASGLGLTIGGAPWLLDWIGLGGGADDC
eukprot:Skav205620  [mRNA]  locus=scaffold4676:28477:35503:+ [translate_table: standard]